MPRYAAGTDVPVERSRAELERILLRYGAERFAYYTDGDKAMVGFRAHGRNLRFVLPLPSRKDDTFVRSPAGRKVYTREVAANLWEQACRERWRALCLAIKAKLEAVETGIAQFESEFMAYTVMPNGKTVGEWAGPQITDALSHGKMPPLLLEMR